MAGAGNIAAYDEGFWTIADWCRLFPGSCRDWRVRFIYQGPNLEGQRAWWVYRGPYFRGVVLC